ncbi:MAG: glycoside hydrolase family 5 protein [Pseudomonadota bacterium]
MIDGKLNRRSLMQKAAFGIAAPVWSPFSGDGTEAFLRQVQYRGVNLSGAEFKSGAIPGRYGTDYRYPARSEFAYFARFGFNCIRLPFRWERLQPRLFEAFDQAEFTRLKACVDIATDLGLYIIISPHNYARYRRQIIGAEETPTAAFLEFWQRLSERLKSQSSVGFGMMNEPHGIAAQSWAQIAQKTVMAIRETGAQNKIFVPGTAWTGVHSWFRKFGDQSNAEALAGLTDPLGRSVIEVHQYLDRNFSGTQPNCPRLKVGETVLRRFAEWLRTHRLRGFLGEFGAAANPDCRAALSHVFQQIQTDSDVWDGWTLWGGGARWNEDYHMALGPRRNGDIAPALQMVLTMDPVVVRPE